MNIFITGVSRGLGKELVLHFIKSGNKVFGLSDSDIDYNDEIEYELLNSDKFQHYIGSINNDEIINSSIEKAKIFMGYIDVIINNAAYKLFKLPDEISDEEYRKSIQTNLIAPILICQRIIPEFLKQKRGCIINIASNAGMIAYKEGTAYCSSKAGLINYTLSLSEYLRDKNISVNVISPPTFSTKDYKINHPEINHNKLLQSERIIKVIDKIIFNKKFITGKNYPFFRFRTFLKYVFKKNLEFLNYLFQPK